MNDRHSAYRDLDAEERKRLFDEHMAGLQAKMEKKVRVDRHAAVS